MLDEALAVPSAERGAWLDALHTRPGLTDATRSALRELLAPGAGVETGDFMSTLPRLGTAPAAANAPRADMEIGPYRLISELGRGGMGAVWLAERSDGRLKRQVALKLPHVTWVGNLAERMARERDILATLEHPHIARLYDAGVDAMGRPWLALEHVQGRSIDAYARERALDVPARLALLLQVCSAVAYAHSRLVIHRDLKPSNILVTDEGQVRLLDFGIAKLVQSEHAEATALTQSAGRALTPDYASPEQVRGEPLGTASDVYSLGVVAYELLAGQRPYRLKRGTAAELEEAIANAEPPLASSAVAAPAGQRQLRGDLDAILNKALKKRPEERYVNVEAFADDLRRHQQGHAVLARPDSRWYVTRKFITRHRVPVFIGAAFAATLTALSTVALIQATEARRQTVAAQQEAQRAQTVQGFLLELFRSNQSTQNDPVAARNQTARELLDRGAERIEEGLKDQPQSRFEVLRTLADMYWQLDLRVQAADLERRRVELARSMYGPRDARLAKVLVDYTETIQDTDRQTETPAVIQEALTVLDAAGESNSEVRGQALLVLATYQQHGSFADSYKVADDAVAFLRQHHPQSDRLVESHVHAARTRIHAGEYEGAVVEAERALAVAQRMGPERRVWTLRPLTTLTDAWAAQLRLDQAEKLAREDLAVRRSLGGDTGSGALSGMARLGVLLQETGQVAEGDALHERVRTALGPPKPLVAGEYRFEHYVAGILSLRMLERGRPDRLELVLKFDLEAQRAGPTNPPLRASRLRLWAALQSTLGQHDAARRELQAAQALWANFSGGKPPAVIDGFFAIARAQIETAAGQPGEALALLERTSPVGPRLVLAHDIERARALLALSRPSEAAAAAARVQQRIGAMPERHRPVAVLADAHLLTGQAQLALGQTDAAAPELERAVDLRQRNDLPNSLWLAQAQIALAQCRAQMGQIDVAKRLLQEARAVHKTLGPAAAAHAPALQRAEAALGMVAGDGRRRQPPQGPT